MEQAWLVLSSQSRREGAGLAREEAGEAEGRPGGDLHAPHTNTHTLPRGSLQMGPGIVTEFGIDMYVLKMDH